MDQCLDFKVRGIESLDLSVSQGMDYRKIGTAIPLLSRFKLPIDKTVSLNANDQFLRLEYQSSVRGFQSFFTTLNTLLNSEGTKADISLKVSFEFETPIQPQGTELNAIKQALNRNPVDHLSWRAKVVY
ncbi:hypothetical protein NG798_24910 [Ancylothrix sp. C2]|uniref:hypothetical protein n=1 Tax=Ancylothrix sp. D3o TaxID=2953691 RepID=UPI0021BAE622|nr:hypothetical protein [Ancylothrix sp. D3o]MCT7953042.1 hypothetical protein [Ancylothrix sp. D3o]